MLSYAEPVKGLEVQPFRVSRSVLWSGRILNLKPISEKQLTTSVENAGCILCQFGDTGHGARSPRPAQKAQGANRQFDLPSPESEQRPVSRALFTTTLCVEPLYDGTPRSREQMFTEKCGIRDFA